MSLDEAAKRGKQRKEERRRAASEDRRERDEARTESERKRLDRVYGIDANLGPFGSYMMAMSGIVAGVMYAARRATPGPKANGTGFIVVTSGIIFALGLVMWLAGRQVPATREAQERWIRERPYPFDGEGYKRSLRDHDSMRGWLRVAIRFATAVDPEVRLKMEDAAIGFGALHAAWVNDRTLYLRSPELDTSVSTKNASYNTARPLHAWFRGFGGKALPVLLDGRAVERVTAYVGRWSDGSWDCVEDNDS